MDENVRATGTIVTHIVLLALGILLLPLSIGMLLSFPHWIFWLGILLSFACFLFFYSGITGLRRGRRQVQQLSKVHQQLQSVHTAVSHPGKLQAQPLTLPDEPLQHEQFEPGQILATWVVPEPEWTAFYAAERRKRLESLWIESFLIFVLGTCFLLLFRTASWTSALTISAALAVTWWLVKYHLHLKVLQSNRTENLIILTTSSVFINGKLHVYYDAHVTPGSIQLYKNTRPMVLEIRYHWKTRRGTTFEELRIPVPSGKETEAQELVHHLSSFLEQSVVTDGVESGK